MKVRAITRNVHVSPRKAGLVCALIRNKKVVEALTILQNTDKKTAKILAKILQSAIANATNNNAMNAEKLFVYGAVANPGKIDKRAMPRAKGSSNMIKKRHAHLEIILSDDFNQRFLDLQAIKNKKANKAKKIVKSVKPVEKVKTETKPKIKTKKELPTKEAK